MWASVNDKFRGTTKKKETHFQKAKVFAVKTFFFRGKQLKITNISLSWPQKIRTRCLFPQAVHLQREAWLTRFEGKGGTEGAPSTSEPSTLNSAAAAAPKLLRRRKPAAVWAAEAEEGEIFLPGSCLSFILLVEASKTRSNFQSKTRVIWVPGCCCCCCCCCCCWCVLDHLNGTHFLGGDKT